jgi:hypothetical protein
VIPCIYSRFPEGCGGTTQCVGCTIRRTVTRTRETGQAQIDVPAFAFVASLAGPVRFELRVSTEPLGHLVLVRVDEAGPTEPAGSMTEAPGP